METGLIFAFSYDASFPKISLFANGELLFESMEVRRLLIACRTAFRFSRLSLEIVILLF